MSKKKVIAIILAAGSGSRMGSKITKQRMSVCGESILLRTVKTFAENDKIHGIILVVRDDEVSWAKEEVDRISKVICIVSGGKDRAESARKGFANIPSDTDYVAIHDGARCLIKNEDISSVVEKAIAYGAASAVSSVHSTVKRIGDDGLISETIPRNELYFAQTPQVFSTDIYKKAINCNEKCENITDDNMLVELIGEKIYPVDIGSYNIKITTSDDISYAEYLIERERNMYETRVGHGYDVHRFCDGRDLILGGVNIPYEKGLLGHSDADVLLHAIMDALLGASALGDIGRIFPDSDDSYLGISSLELLCRVEKLIRKNGFEVINIDATVIMERPKLAPYIEEMIHNISDTLKIELSRINIKATTEEKLGFTGSGDGASAHAVAMLRKKY